MADDNEDVLARLDALLKRHGVNAHPESDIPTLTEEVDPASINEGGIPTLTEVVVAEEVPPTATTAVESVSPTTLDIDALVEEVAERVRASLEAQMSESLKNELKARLKSAYSQMVIAALGELRRELDKTVAIHVREAVAARLAGSTPPES